MEGQQGNSRERGRPGKAVVGFAWPVTCGFQAMRLPPEVNRAVYVRNLPFKISADEMYDIFGKYGAIRQIRLGDRQDTRGTAFVVYEDIYDAKAAVDHLSGFNVCGRYLIVLYYQPAKMQKRMDQQAKKQELEELRAKLRSAKEDPEAPEAAGSK